MRDKAILVEGLVKRFGEAPSATGSISRCRRDSVRLLGANGAGKITALRVVAFDYERHVLKVFKPDRLTLDNIFAEIFAVADAAGTGLLPTYHAKDVADRLWG